MTDLQFVYLAVMGWALLNTLAACLPWPRRMRTPGTAYISFLIPAIIAAVGVAADLLKTHAANKSVDEQQKMYNNWLAARQAGITNITTELLDHGIDIFGPSTTTTTGTSTTTTKSKQAPFITPEYKQLADMFKGIIQGRLAAPTALPPGYAESAVRAVNEAYRGADVAARNAAAARGSGGAESYALNAPVAVARGGKIADTMANLPLLERSLQNEDLAAAQAAIAAFGKGTTGTSTGTTSSMGSVTSPPNLSVLADLLLPPAPNAPSATGISTAGAGASGLYNALLSLYMLNKLQPASSAPAAG